LLLTWIVMAVQPIQQPGAAQTAQAVQGDEPCSERNQHSRRVQYSRQEHRGDETGQRRRRDPPWSTWEGEDGTSSWWRWG